MSFHLKIRSPNTIFPDIFRLKNKNKDCMKRTFSLLFLTLLLTYGWLGYRLATDNGHVACATEGCLSDIAKEVKAIRLDTNTLRPEQIRNVQSDRKHIFLTCARRLYHFMASGECIGEIGGDGQPLEVADYTVDPTHQQLIVLGHDGAIYYYTYDGVCTGKSRLPREESWLAVGDVAYYDGGLWLTVDCVGFESQTGGLAVEQWLYRLDKDCRITERRQLHAADTGRVAVDYLPRPQISISNGQVYTHVSGTPAAYILETTLQLLHNLLIGNAVDATSILPLQVGPRFLFTANPYAQTAEERYIFCYDGQKKHAILAQGGLEDDFYGTGKVTDLQPADPYNRVYCYIKPQTGLRDTFPQAETDGSPVLYFVIMKT